ncbi:MAG: AAA family ATPase [Planctomycetota bacterium]
MSDYGSIYDRDVTPEPVSAGSPNGAPPVGAIGGSTQGPAAQTSEPPEVQPLALFHRIMRKYYIWAIVLGLVLGLPAAYAGYKFIPKEYTSTGQLVIETEPERMLFDIEETRGPRSVSLVAATQAELLGQRRVMERASAKLEREGISWPIGNDGVVRLISSMDIFDSRRAPIVYCSATDQSAVIAERMANAVLDAYKELYIDNVSNRQRRDSLQSVRDNQTREIREIQEEIDRLSRAYGTSDLAPLEAAGARRISELSARIDDLLLARNQATASLARSGEDGPGELDEEPEDPPEAMAAGELPPERVLEAMATNDERLKGLLDYWRALQDQRTRMSLTFSPEHRQMKRNAVSLAAARQDLLARVEELGIPEDATVTASDPQERLDQINRLIEQEEQRLTTLQNEQNVMRLARNEIDERLRVKRDKESILGEVTRELEQIEAELAGNNDFDRVQVEPAPIPLTPSADKRNAVAAAGLAAGFGFSGVLFFAIGFLGLGYERIGDLEELGHLTPTIGVMPDRDDPDAADQTMASLSVHHLRNLLLVRRQGQKVCRIYAVTSPAPSDGKTSLVDHLGTSFAKVGHKALVVDADMIGHSLSRQSGFGEEDGLWQALDNAPLEDCVHESEHEGLFVMPSGALRTAQPERMSGESLVRLIARLREQYDTVLIDTGPLLGSLDASLVVSASDETLLVVSRGRRARMVKAAIARLKSLGVSRASIVFNRALWSDLGSSVSGVSISGPSLRSVAPDEVRPGSSGRSVKRRLRTTSGGGAPKL